jgi:hypothetical protein
MDIGQAQRGELAHQIFEQHLRVFVHDVVGWRDRRDADADLAGTDGIGHGAHAFQHQTGAVLDAAAVVVAALVGAGLEELIEQIAVGCMQLHAIEARRLHGFARGGGETVNNARQLLLPECARCRGGDKLALPRLRSIT